MTRRLPSLSLRLALPLTLLLGAAPAAAAPASLAVSWSGEADLGLDALTVRVDGADVPVALPAAGDQTATVHQGTLAAGARGVAIEASLRGSSRVFTYMDGYRYVMRGRLDLQVADGDAVTVEADVVEVPGVTVKPEERYRLALSAKVRHADGALEQSKASGSEPVEVIPPRAAVSAAPAAAAVAAAPAEPAAPPAPATACALGPVRFAFDSASLDPEAREALAGFAACLAGRGGLAQVTGYWDPLGDPDYNVQLGERRARAAATHLTSAGLPAARVQVVPAKAAADLCQELTPACRALNRRVEVRVEE